MSKRAVVVIDLQNEYLPSGKLPLNGIETAAANAAKVIADARTRHEPVIHVQHVFANGEMPVFEPGSNGIGIQPSVAPEAGEPVVVKNHVNAFRDTELKRLLDERDVSEVVVVGAMSHMCVDAGVRAAADMGYSVTVVHDACATMDLEFGGVTVPAQQVHAAMMASLGFAYAKLKSTREYLGQ